MPRSNRQRMSPAEDVPQKSPAGCREDSAPQLPGLDALPVERVIQILRLLPLKQVFVFMRVNKKWEAAARQVVREKTGMHIMLKKNSSSSLLSELDVIEIVAAKHQKRELKIWEENCNRMWKSLLQMESLQVYIITIEPGLGMVCNTDYWPLAVKNAQTLKEMHVPGVFPEEKEAGSEVAFPNLKILSCGRLTAAAACPLLRSVSLYGFKQDLAALNQLNMEKMQDFELINFELSATNVQPLVTVINRMVNLTGLHLVLDANQEYDDDNTFLPVFRIFDSSHLLEDVSITIDGYAHNEKMDEMIETLVRRNPGLRKVTFQCAYLSDKSLVSLSRLNHLEELQLLEYDWYHVWFTTSGVLRLLRGGSRAVLSSLRLGSTEGDYDLDVLRQEVLQIQTETGKLFQTAEIGYESLFE